MFSIVRTVIGTLFKKFAKPHNNFRVLFFETTQLSIYDFLKTSFDNLL